MPLLDANGERLTLTKGDAREASHIDDRFGDDFLYVDDVDAHCAVARAAGATLTTEPADHEYGQWSDRSYGAVDLEGHHWWFSQRVRGNSE